MKRGHEGASMFYLIFKMIHLMGVVLFLGNLIISAYWKIRADRTHDLKFIVFAYEEVIRTDYFFTLPGAVMILGGGCGMVWLIGYPFLQMPWLVWSTILLGIAGVLWATVLAPCQRKMLRLAEQGLVTGRADARLVCLARIWYLVGSTATMLPLVAGFLMITRPG
jgi:uncharacterized membrane protein